MNPRARRIMRILLLVLSIDLAFVLLGGANPRASPTKPATVERKIVQRIPLDETGEELQMTLVTFPPGAQSTPHVHPVPGMIYIIAGTVDSQYEGGPLEHYKAGDTYLDRKDQVHAVFRNTSSTVPLRFLIACKIGKGVPFKQELPKRVEGPARSCPNRPGPLSYE